MTTITEPISQRNYADQEFGEFLSDVTIGVNQIGDELAQALGAEDRKEKMREVFEKLRGICMRMCRKVSSYAPDDFRHEDMPRLIDLCGYCSNDGLRTEDRLVWIYNCLVLNEKGMKPLFCDYKNEAKRSLSYATDVQNAISCSNDPNELLFHWRQWREKLDDEDRKLFLEVVDTTRSFAERRNESTAVFYYLLAGRDKFYQQILDVYNEILPIYRQLHAYIRHQLRQKYGDHIPKEGPIPQHFMDQVFAQANRNEFISFPYPEEVTPNFTEREVELGFTGLKQIETANEFFDSIGLPLPENFWNKYVSPSPVESSSKIGKPSENFKYEFNPKLGFETFLNGFADLLNLRYKMEFSKFSYPWDREPCPGFSDALVKAVKLSVLTPSYLNSINLLNNKINTNEFEINRLYKLALESVLAMPVHILNDKFWIELSSGNIEKDKLESEYEKMLLEMAGISVPHRDENYKLNLPYQFLKGASYTRPNTVNIFSEVMGYEIYKGLCKKAGLYDPEKPSSYLKDCNFYGHKEAGKCLSDIMSYGNRKDWSVILEPLTGKSKLSASGILEYFKPLTDWLTVENEKNWRNDWLAVLDSYWN